MLFIHLLAHAFIIMYIFLHFVFLVICNISLLFTLMFVCLHVDYVTNVLRYVFLYVNAPVCVLKCWYFYYVFLLLYIFNIFTIQYFCNLCKYSILLLTNFVLFIYLFNYLFIYSCISHKWIYVSVQFVVISIPNVFVCYTSLLVWINWLSETWVTHN